MSLSINQFSKIANDTTMFNKTFRRLMEANLTWLRNNPANTVIPIDPHGTYKYEGDFYGLLDNLGINKKYHWIVMRMNNIYRPGDVNEELSSIEVPDIQSIERLITMYNTKNKKTLV